MRAITVENGTLVPGEVERPALGADDIRIDVRATAVNRADLLQRIGNYPPPPGASTIIGLECAGVVSAVGANVREWSIGDRVMALLPGGGYAEEAVVHAGSAMRVPSALTDEEAAAIPEVFLTAFLNLFMLARVREGESALIHGGGSGVGTAATTLLKLAGVRARDGGVGREMRALSRAWRGRGDQLSRRRLCRESARGERDPRPHRRTLSPA